jgi:hypothetical protein
MEAAPQVHQAGARLPVQVASKLHVAEPGMVKSPSISGHRSAGSPTVTGCLIQAGRKRISDS